MLGQFQKEQRSLTSSHPLLALQLTSWSVYKKVTYKALPGFLNQGNPNIQSRLLVLGRFSTHTSSMGDGVGTSAPTVMRLCTLLRTML